MSYAFLKSTDFDHSNIIYNISKATGCESYLELGLYKGSTINLINTVVPKCVGVDVVPVEINGEFFLGTTEEFFKFNTNTFDIIFIDADHKFESVEKDFNNSLKILNKYGVIFIHDTDPISKEFIDPEYCGNSYRFIDVINKNKYLNFITLPILEAGLTIINRKSDRRIYDYKGEGYVQK